VSNLIKQTILDLIAQIDPKTMIVGDNNPTLSPIDRSSSKKSTSKLNDIIDQMDITRIYRVFYPAVVQYTLFSTVHGKFYKTVHILGHKGSSNKYKKVQMTLPANLYYHNATKLELNDNINTEKHRHLETKQHRGE
jgi:hypothetical protein